MDQMLLFIARKKRGNKAFSVSHRAKNLPTQVARNGRQTSS
jgi:hypothetical protein